MSASFDSYKIFYYVGKYKNITHAANSLFLSQSTVSRCIQSLEAEIGCRLFERSQHGVEFTVEGEVLYNHIVPACESIFAGEEKIKQIQQFGEGAIRLGVSDFTFQQYVLPVLKDFRNDFPGVQLEVVYLPFDANSTYFVDIVTGKLDFACLSLLENPEFPELDAQPVVEFHDIVIAGDEFSDLKQGAFELGYLVERYPFVSLHKTGADSSFLECMLLPREIYVTPAFVVNTISLFMPMVSQGLCLALIPDLYFDRIDPQRRLFEVSLSNPLPSRKVWILTPVSAARNAARDELIRRIKAYINSAKPE